MEQTLKVTDINTRDIPQLWGLVKDMLQKAVDKNQGEFDLQDIYTDLQSGRAILWVAYDVTGLLRACAVCEFRDFATKRSCYIVLLSGRGFQEWSWAINAIEEWAVKNGANTLVAYTREGFVKLMEPYGFKKTYTVIQKNLTDRSIH